MVLYVDEPSLFFNAVMTTTQNTEVAQFRDITWSKNYYYFRSTRGPESFKKEQHQEGNPCAKLRDYGSLMFSDVLPEGVPSAVIVDIERRGGTRANPEIAIVFHGHGKTIGLMCEVRSGTYNRVLQALTKSPALLSGIFGAFEDDASSVDLSVPRNTSIQKFASTITWNPNRNELEVNRFPKNE